MVSNDRKMKHVLTKLTEFVAVDGTRLSLLNKSNSCWLKPF